MDFRSPQHLIWFVIITAGSAVFLIWTIRHRQQQAKLFGYPPWSVPRWPGWRALVLAIAMSVLALALTGPAWGEESELVYTSGSDLFILLDCSASMQCRDILPSRLQTAGFLAMGLLKELPGIRAGLVVFAGDAFPACPLTGDHQLIRSLLSSPDPEMLSRQGTDYGSLFRVLERVLYKREPGRRLNILLLSDGEYFNRPEAGDFRRIRSFNPRFIAAGIGTEQGGMIEIPGPHGPEMLKDGEGKPVVSTLRKDNLQALCQSLDGSYYQLETVGLTARQILDRHLRNQEAGSFSSQQRPKVRTSQLLWFPFLMLALFLCSDPLPRLHFKRYTPVLALMAAGLCWSCRTGPGDHAATGNRLFEQGHFAEAAARYEKALAGWPDRTEARQVLAINLSGALALAGSPDRGQTVSAGALATGTPGGHFDDLSYNLGCCQMLLHRPQDAATAFRRCLESNPGHQNARWNLELLQQSEPPGPAPPVPPPPAPPRFPGMERYLDSLRDQEKSVQPKKPARPKQDGGPSW